MNKRNLALLVILGLIFLPLSAAIVASYIPAPDLAFTSVFSGFPRPPNFPPFADSNFVAHLGTLTIHATDGDILYQPSLINSQISSRFNFNGPVTWYSQGNPPVPVYGDQNTGFSLVAITSELGTSGYQALWGGSGTIPLTNSIAAINSPTFVAEFYFIGDQNKNIYKPGSEYTLSSGSTGMFNVAVAPNNQGIYNQQSNNINVPVYDIEPIPPGATVPSGPPVLILPGTPALPYGDPPDNAIYGFSILDEQSFSLPNGYLANTTKIASAQLNLSNTLVGRTYGVDITFSKLPGSTSFALRPTGSPSLYAIPYQLKFLGQAVVKDVSMSWTPLFDGINSQDIHITGISPTVALAAPSGSYLDTIVVTIAPIE